MIFEGMLKNLDRSTVLVESHHTPSDAPTTSQSPLSSPSRIPTRQETEVPQPSSPTHTHVVDEAAFIGVDVRHGGPVTTVSSLNAGHGSEDPSKQRMSIIKEIDQDIEIHLVTPTHVSTQGEAHSQESQPEDHLGFFSAAMLLAEVAKVHTYTRRRKTISTAEELVSIAGASMPVSTAGMVDTGKAIMQESEPELTITKLQQRQERAGYEVTIRLQEQLDEKERQRIARGHKEASSFNIEEWEDIKATIEADKKLALMIQAEEREKCFEAEKARLLVDLINQRKRHFSKQRAKERRNKSLTQAQ
nr:hypothetical protein [Tanacetum cinerariifolium]